jgi:integrase
MGVRKSRERYVVEFEQAGIRVFRRCPAGITKTQAEALETKLRRELFDRDRLGKKADLTIQKAIELWLANNHRKNQKQALSEAKQWQPWHPRPLSQAPEAATEALAEWLSKRRSEPTSASPSAVVVRAVVAKPSTLNRRLALLKAVCKWAWKNNLIADNLSGKITMLPERNAREVYLTKKQVKALADASPSPIREAIWIAAYSGLRASELLALPSATSRQDTLGVPTSKTGKPRQVPIAKPLIPYLSSLPLGLSYWQLHDGFDAARKAAGMPHVQFHDLRHTAASWLINAGVDLYTVGRILGHSSTQTTARYAHLSDASLKAAMRKLK